MPSREVRPPLIVLEAEDARERMADVVPGGPVVLLLAGERDREWCAEAALDLCAAWAAGSRRVVLADLHLERPLLHAGAGAERLEGVIDAFLYGASFLRIVTPVRDGTFHLIPAGTQTQDIGAIYRHPRWNRLVEAFRDTDATLVLFVPAEIPELPAIAAWSSEAILLGSAAETGVAETLETDGVDVLAVVKEHPTESMTLPLRSEKAADEGEPGGTPDELDTGALPSPEPSAATPTAQLPHEVIDLELPPSPMRQGRGTRRTLAFLFVLLLVAILAAGAFVLVSLRPDLFPRASEVDASGGSGDESSSIATARREGELLSYSVHVSAFSSMNAAREAMDRGQGSFTSIPFFISPEEIQGVLYYRIFAGLAADTLTGLALGDRFVEAGLIEEVDAISSSGTLQEVPLAFDLGTFDTREEAMIRSDSLLLRQIPTYLVAVPYSDGNLRWQLYGGAYRDGFSSARMRRMLSTVVDSVRLAVRAGLPIAGVE